MTESGTTSTFARPFGMNLRTYIATQIMSGLLAGDVDGDFCTDIQAPARAAVQMADALIAELNK